MWFVVSVAAAGYGRCVDSGARMKGPAMRGEGHDRHAASRAPIRLLPHDKGVAAMILCRRDVMAGAGALAVASLLPAAAHAASFVSKRPAPGKRNFTSPAIEAEIKRVKAAIADPELAWLFEDCYPNTLDTTVERSEERRVGTGCGT